MPGSQPTVLTRKRAPAGVLAAAQAIASRSAGAASTVSARTTSRIPQAPQPAQASKATSSAGCAARGQRRASRRASVCSGSASAPTSRPSGRKSVIATASLVSSHSAGSPASIEKGKAGKILLEATRQKGADGDIALAPLFVPANVTAAPKPVPKGQTKADFPVTVAGNAAAGPAPFAFRATTKVGGKDYAVTPAPAIIDIVDPKKAEPKKKDEPKKGKE